MQYVVYFFKIYLKNIPLSPQKTEITIITLRMTFLSFSIKKVELTEARDTRNYPYEEKMKIKQFYA